MTPKSSKFIALKHGLLCSIVETHERLHEALGVLVIVPAGNSAKEAQDYVTRRMSVLDPLFDYWYVGGLWTGVIKNEFHVPRSYNFTGEFGQWDYNTIACSEVDTKVYLPSIVLLPNYTSQWVWDDDNCFDKKKIKDWQEIVKDALDQYGNDLAVSVYAGLSQAKSVKLSMNTRIVMNDIREREKGLQELLQTQEAA